MRQISKNLLCFRRALNLYISMLSISALGTDCAYDNLLYEYSECQNNEESSVSDFFVTNCLDTNVVSRPANLIISFIIGKPWESSKESYNMVFDKLNNLDHISLNNKNLTCFPRSIFKFLTSASELDLSHNCLKALSNNFGANMSKLKDLFLQHNQISCIPIDFGSEIPKLEKLFLNNNRLSALPPKFGKHLEIIKFLNLNENRLSELPSKFVKYFPNIEYLYLSGNNLKDLPFNFGKNWPKLTELYCSGNKIAKIHKNFGAGMANLLFLDLSYNQLTKVPSSLLKKCPNLVDLNLQSNQLKTLPFEFLKNERKFYIDLRGNPDFNYYDIPKIGAGLKSLRAHYGRYLLYNWDGFPSRIKLHQQVQTDLRWNYCKLTTLKTKMMKIEKFEISLDECKSIIYRLENFPKVSNRMSLSKTKTINIFDLVESEVSHKMSTTASSIRNRIINFFEKLLNTTNYKDCYKSNQRYKSDILNFLSIILVNIDKMKNINYIKDTLVSLYSIIHYNNLFQYHDFYKLYRSVARLDDQEDSLQNFVMATILDYKNEVFESILWEKMAKSAIKTFFVWYMALQFDLDLKLESYDLQFSIADNRRFNINKKQLKDAFYTKFTPESAIDHLTAQIGTKFEIPTEEIYKALSSAVYGNSIKKATPSFSTLDDDIVNKQLRCLMEKYLKKLGLIADD